MTLLSIAGVVAIFLLGCIVGAVALFFKVLGGK